MGESDHLEANGSDVRPLIYMVKKRKQAEHQLELLCVLGAPELYPGYEKELKRRVGELRVFPGEGK